MIAQVDNAKESGHKPHGIEMGSLFALTIFLIHQGIVIF